MKLEAFIPGTWTMTLQQEAFACLLLNFVDFIILCAAQNVQQSKPIAHFLKYHKSDKHYRRKLVFSLGYTAFFPPSISFFCPFTL